MKWFNWLINLLFPAKCVLCGRILDSTEQEICGACACSVPEHDGCCKTPHHVNRKTVLWFYEDTVRESLLRLKFHNKPGYGRVFGRLLGQKLAAEDPGAELVTWVPVSPQRRQERGYDQAELIARAAAGALGVGCVSTLKKIRHNPAQSGISDAAVRRENVRDAYIVTDAAQVQGKRVLLIDDILTTGATAGECAGMLMKSGAKSVSLGAVAAGRKKQTSIQKAGTNPAEDGTYQK